MAKPVSQSRTEWVKKGTVVDGKKVTKGYVAQKGRPEKRVTARVKLEQTTRRGKTGDVAVYKSGRYKKTVGKGRVDRSKTTTGGGYTGYKAPSSSNGSAGTSGGDNVPEVTESPKTAAQRLTWKSGGVGGYQAGASYSSKQGGSASGSAEGAHAAMASSRKELAKRTSVARSRRRNVVQGAAYTAGLANPATRIPTFLTGAAHAGYQVGKKNKKSIRRITGAPGRFWRGY